MTTETFTKHMHDSLTPHVQRPGEELLVRQMSYWAAAIEVEPFTYDVVLRKGIEHELDHDEILDEILRDDTYRLGAFGRQGDVWVDAGSHIGTFAIAAMMHGYDVSVMVDMDPTMAWCAEVNARGFLMQQVIREARRRVRPIGWVEELSDAHSLAEMGMQTKEVWSDRSRRSCLKLDVQGAERQILAGGGATVLSEAFDALVMEWHHELPEALGLLESGGWRIEHVKGHTDVLLNTDTRIVWAVSG